MGRSAKKQMLTLNFFNNENSKELFWKSDCDYKVLLYHLHNLVFKQFVVVFESKRVVTCMLKKYLCWSSIKNRQKYIIFGCVTDRFRCIPKCFLGVYYISKVPQNLTSASCKLRDHSNLNNLMAVNKVSCEFFWCFKA